jgi:diguanylate cyclase (GGDEF)-like protein/putative nucleotidyltransferase with HDIG domain
VNSQERAIRGYPPRLFGLAVVLIATAVPITAGALTRILAHPPNASTALSVGLFLVLALFAELKPVPLEVDGKRLVSLAFIFLISTLMLFGWEYAVVVGAASMLIAEAYGRRPLLRLLFNAAVYAVAVFAASLPAVWLSVGVGSSDHMAYARLIASVFVTGAIFVAVNVFLVCFAIALFESLSPREVLIDHLRHSAPAFVTMAFLAALAVILWSVEPPLLLLLAGPLITLSLYQRYALSTRVAQHAAATDNLTGLLNHRAYQGDIREAIESADGEPVTLCLIDIDDFKSINDRLGHPVGDRILQTFSGLLTDAAEAGKAYRLGGDEFAIVVPGSADEGVKAIESLRSLLGEAIFELGARVTISAGLASYPESAADPDELQRVADVALYWTKRHGKNRWCVYSPSVVEVSWPAELAAMAEFEARLRAAENLVRVVDARDTYTGCHSQSVAVLADAVARQLGLDEELVERVRLAALLHDLGKIGIPDHILRKPGVLEPDELLILERHPQIGFELLDGVDVAPVDTWILHHHEHWDGSGYPLGLRGEEIPLGSRIILVADAFDAMTTDRSYRRAVDPEAALDEIRRASGAQFDPAVVEALEAHLGAPVRGTSRVLAREVA